MGPRGEVPPLRIILGGDREFDFSLFGASCTVATHSSEPDSVSIESPSSAGAATPKVAVELVAPSDDIARRRGIGTDPYCVRLITCRMGITCESTWGVPTFRGGGTRGTTVPVAPAPTDLSVSVQVQTNTTEAHTHTDSRIRWGCGCGVMLGPTRLFALTRGVLVTRTRNQFARPIRAAEKTVTQIMCTSM